MKVKDGYILRKVAGNYIVVAVGAEAIDFNGLITTNETGAFLWEKLSNDMTQAQLTDCLLDEYDVDSDTAAKDVDAFIKKLTEAELIIL